MEHQIQKEQSGICTYGSLEQIVYNQTTKKYLEVRIMRATIEEMKTYIKRNNLTHMVVELNMDGTKEGAIAAIEYVYDGHTLSKEEFKAKYFG